MNKFVRLCFLLLLVITAFQPIHASEKLSSSIDLPVLDNDSLYNVFNQTPEYANTSGIDIKIAMDLLKSIEPIKVNGKWIRTISLNAKNALGLIFNFEDFQLSRYSKLNISSNIDNQNESYSYSADKDQKKFTTNVIWGNRFNFEYISDIPYMDDANINLNTVTYLYYLPNSARVFFAPPVGVGGSCQSGYINYNNYCYYNGETPPEANTDASLSCYTDANCTSNPSQYCKEIRSTVMIGIKYTWVRLFESSSSSCQDNIAVLTYFQSGVLVNNTRNDMTPYVLTAGHSVDLRVRDAPRFALDANYPSCGNVTVRTQNTFIDEWLIYFNYQRPTCDNLLAGNNRLTTKGVEVLYNGLSSTPYCADIALLKILDNPNSAYDIPIGYDHYYAGWNSLMPPATPANYTVMSHPKGDLKKMYLAPICTTTCYSASSHAFSLLTAIGNPLQVGMSGSGAFDEEHRVRGVVYAGSNLDVCTTNGQISVTKLSHCWANIKPFLDPDNTNVTSIDGYDPLASCRTSVEVHGNMYPAATWRAQNQMTIQAQTEIIAPPSNLTCSILASPTYTIGTKQPYQTQSDYIFKAGQSVKLLPGFSVSSGNKFSARIGPCSTYTSCSNVGGYNKKSNIDNNFHKEINQVVPLETEISLHPNPANNNITLNFNEQQLQTTEQFQILITDITGKSIISLKHKVDNIRALSKEIDISNINPGVYYCVVLGHKEYKFKLIVIR